MAELLFKGALGVIKSVQLKSSWTYQTHRGIYFLDIQRSADFYQKADVRPPFTYASLIRQVNLNFPFLMVRKV